jgi:hypothetical protein
VLAATFRQRFACSRHSEGSPGIVTLPFVTVPPSKIAFQSHHLGKSRWSVCGAMCLLTQNAGTNFSALAAYLGYLAHDARKYTSCTSITELMVTPGLGKGRSDMAHVFDVVLGERIDDNDVAPYLLRDHLRACTAELGLDKHRSDL